MGLMFALPRHGGPHLAVCPLCSQLVQWVVLNMNAVDDRKGRKTYQVRRRWLTETHYVKTQHGQVKCAGYEKDSLPSLKQ